MTVYLFDKDKKVKKPIAWEEITDLQHDENANRLTAQIISAVEAKNGEFLGFKCADERFRLFLIDNVYRDDDKGTSDISAIDAIVAELQEHIIEELQQLDVDLRTAITAMLPAGQWTITGNQPERVEKSRAYFTSAWDMIKTFEGLYEWHISQYYTFAQGEIQGKIIEMDDGEPVFRGRILQSRVSASKVAVTVRNKPITRLYGLGPAEGSRDTQTNMTIKKVVWSKAAGDPADKPEGQMYIEDEAAIAKHGMHTAVVTFTGVSTEDELAQKTWEHLQTIKEPSVTVDANMADMEMLQGHSYMAVRLGDLVAIRLNDGSLIVAKVISIKRNYKKPWLTKIIIGSKKESITGQVSTLNANALHTFERLTVYQNRFHEDEALIQLNAEFVQANAKNIELNAEGIRLNAEDIEANAKQILANAESIEVNALRIALNAEEIETNAKKIIANADNIEVNAEKIEANAKNILVNTQRIETNAKNILVNAQSIETNAKNILVNAQSIETNAKNILVKADRVELDAFVRASELETDILTVVNSAYIGGILSSMDLWCNTLAANTSVWTEYLNAYDVTTAGLTVGDTAAEWKGQTVVTNIGTISQSKRFLNLRLADGGSVQLDIVTDVSISPNTTYLQYLGT